MMNGPYTEQLDDGIALSVVLVRHLYTRHLLGPVVIISDRPDILLPALKKQWLKLLRQVQIERSATLSTVRLLELTRQIARMQGLQFSTEYLSVDAGVVVVTMDEYAAMPLVCYVTLLCSSAHYNKPSLRC